MNTQVTPEILQSTLDDFSRLTEEKLRHWGFSMSFSVSGDQQRHSDWALLITGAVLALIFPNVRNMLEVYDIFFLKIAVSLLLLSGVAGLFAKNCLRKMESNLSEKIGEPDDYLSKILNNYYDQLKMLKQKASEKNLELKETLNLLVIFDPVIGEISGKLAKTLQQKKDDTQAKWKEQKRYWKRHLAYIFFQHISLVAAFLTLLLTLKTPH